MKRSKIAFAAGLFGTVYAAGMAVAAGNPPSGRYAMTTIEGGFLRMDTNTGVVSHCARQADGWACVTVKDDYQAIQKRVDELAQENADLKNELAELRRLEGQAPSPGSGPPGGQGKGLGLPSEEEIDKALNYFDKLLKKFREFVDKQTDRPPSGKPL